MKKKTLKNRLSFTVKDLSSLTQDESQALRAGKAAQLTNPTSKYACCDDAHAISGCRLCPTWQGSCPDTQYKNCVAL